MNEFEESQNERKKALKFEIQLKEEADELDNLDKLDEDKADGINLDDIGIGRGGADQ